MALMDAPVGPASDVSATRTNVRRAAVRCGAIAVLAIALLGAATWRWTERKRPITGEIATGTVVETTTRNITRAGTHVGNVTVEQPAGAAGRVSIDVGDHLARYAVGDRVDLVVDRDDPPALRSSVNPSRPPVSRR
jgi:hypothetical protein